MLDGPDQSYLRDETLLADKKKDRVIMRKAPRYVIIDEKLNRRSFNTPYLLCLHPEDEDYVLREIHKEVCENHPRIKTMSHKVLKKGYYRPTIFADA